MTKHITVEVAESPGIIHRHWFYTRKVAKAFAAYSGGRIRFIIVAGVALKNKKSSYTNSMHVKHISFNL